MRLPRPALPAWLLAGTAALPVFVWWLGWYPGFGSSDTIDQFGQVATGTYFNHHPAIHTLYLDIFSLGGSRPGLVALVQLLSFGVLLAYAARWLVEAGAPVWAAVGAAWLLGTIPRHRTHDVGAVEGRPLRPLHALGLDRAARSRRRP